MRVLAVEGLAVEADSLAPAVLWPSSWSSVISSSFCLREDRLEELLEGAAVCSEHAAASWASPSSWAAVMSKVVSWGANLSVTAVKCTATRAVEHVSGAGVGVGGGQVGADVPCSSREVPSGRYLIRTLRRRYRRKPYKGDFSS